MSSNRKLLAVKAAVVAATIPLLIQAFSGGPPPAVTGAPGEPTCAQAGCHFGTPVANSNEIAIAFPKADYTPGETQRWTLQASHSGAFFFGFQLTVRDSSNAQAGMLSAIDGTTQIVTSGPLQYIEHTLPSGTGNFVFDWTAPAAGTGAVTVHVAVNAANGNGQPTGDTILLRSFSLPEAASGGVKPVISGNDSVVNGASFQPGLTAGSWVTIFGTELAPVTRTWDPATEIINGKFPATLDGVSVEINGKPASVFYISPIQLNVQSPDDESVGPVMVQVFRDGVASDPVIAQLQRYAPGLFVFEQGGGRYAAAVHALLEDGRPVFVAPNGLFGDAERSRAAKAGDIILLFGTGFGPTDPPVPSGQVFEGAASLTDPVTIRFGAVVANDVQFAGISAAGLYQFNVRVPDGLPEGDIPVTAEIGGLSSQDGVFITVDN